MNRRRLLSALSGLGLLPAVPACAQEAEAQGLEGLLAQTATPALAGAVFDDKGLRHIEFGGVRRKGQGAPVARDEVWHLGSNTKAMTAALYGRLVDQGKARWGATLGELFAGLTVDPGFARQPVESLLGHRSGILDAPVMRGGYLLKAHADTRPLAAQRAELAASLLSKAPAGEAGAFAYSNLGYVLAGAAIERITGRSWEEVIAAELFKPLRMASAGFGAPKGENAWGHRAVLPAAPLLPVDPAGRADNPAVLGPAGTAHANLADYGKFLRLFLTDGGGLLKPGTLQSLLVPAPGEGRPYALGWGVSTPPWGQGPVLAHEGSNTMWHAVAIVAPGRKLAFVGLANGPPDATKGAARSLAVQLRKRFAPD
ncbi:MAG TPA: serine hydrolase domain-containing protein [Caulobacter sp.]|nr:serine hydrolase domain-containing protein [Caulobacter sp.]